MNSNESNVKYLRNYILEEPSLQPNANLSEAMFIFYCVEQKL